MYREANNKEKKEFKAGKRRREEEGLDRGVQQDKAIPTVTNTMGLGLDYRDWDATDTTEEESSLQVNERWHQITAMMIGKKQTGL